MWTDRTIVTGLDGPATEFLEINIVDLRGPDDQLLTPSEVAALFRVDPKTVTRWARAGKINAIRTLGGHRRYRASEVSALLAGFPPGEQAASSDA